MKTIDRIDVALGDIRLTDDTRDHFVGQTGDRQPSVVKDLVMRELSLRRDHVLKRDLCKAQFFAGVPGTFLVDLVPIAVVTLPASLLTLVVFAVGPLEHGNRVWIGHFQTGCDQQLPQDVS